MSRQLLSPNIFILFSDDADLWIGYTFGGIGRLHNGKITNVEGHDLPGGSVVAFARTRDGVLWAAASSGLIRFVSGRWQRDTTFHGHHIATMLVVGDTLWVKDSEGWYARAADGRSFHRFSKDDALRMFADTPHRPGWRWQDDDQFNFTGPDGAQWKLTSTFDGLRRSRWGTDPHRAIVEKMSTQQGLSGSPQRLLMDREGNVWAGSVGGLDQFRVGKLMPLMLPGTVGLPAFAPGEHGDIWIGDQLQKAVHVLGTGGEGVSIVSAFGQGVECVLRDPHGAIWAAGAAGIMRLENGTKSEIPLPDELLQQNRLGYLWQRFQALAMDSEDGLWLSVAKYDLYRWKDGVWIRHGGLSGLPPGPAIRLFNDATGRMWFTYPNNRVASLDHGVVKNYTSADGLAVGNVLGISVRDDDVWVSGDRGVAHLVNGHFVMLHGIEGEAFPATAGIVGTATGELWLESARGLYRIPADELQKARKDPHHSVAFELLDRSDGLRGASIQLRPGPSLQLGPDGRLWVARVSGISSIDPQHIRRNTIAPEVFIEALHVADKLLPATAGLTLPKLTHNLSFDYTAPSLTRPELVHFRYQLEGVDDGWQNAQTRRQAFYNNLGPGHYRFRVRAANEDGLWSTHDAVFDFSIAPAFYQTWWFNVLCGIAAMGVLWLLYLLRLRQLAARAHIRTVERERIARDLHDTLLQSLQGLQLRLQTWAANKALAVDHRHEVNDVALRTGDMLIDGRDRIIALRRTDMPLDDLVASLRGLGNEYASMYHVEFVLTEAGEPRALQPEVITEALDITREGLRNAFVHADAKRVELFVVWQKSGMEIRVVDDGCGIDETILRDGGRAGHWGLLGMRERAANIGARIDLRRRDEGGTELQLMVPARRIYASTPWQLRWYLRRVWSKFV
ncbi:MAG: triple tyrosine motif-containing protein [Rhodanobacter sp.]